MISMDGVLTNETINRARSVLRDESNAEEMVETNFRLGCQHYSFRVLRRRIQLLIEQRFGWSI